MRPRLVALLACLALAPAAEAEASWVVKGRGFGHGVGMSQWGAYGFAKQGKGHRAILGHYYRGTTVGRLAGPRPVRVLVGIHRGGVAFSGAGRACGRRLSPRRGYEARRAGGSVQLRNAAGRRLADCGRKLRAGGGGTVRIAGTLYRGALEVVPTESSAGSVNAINAVPVDQYLKGVVPNESPPSWPLAALRAQAVAARSFALTGGVDGNGFDLYADTRSQVYKGLASETARTNRAVEQTRGEVIRHGGRIVPGFYSACSGGHTESVENVFFGPPAPYLVGVPDPYDHHCPLHTWTLRFSDAQIGARLGRYLRGRLQRVTVIKRGVSPRIVEARLHGSGGVTRIRGDRLAYALGAYDRWMNICRVRGAQRQCSGAGQTAPSPSPSPPPGGISG